MIINNPDHIKALSEEPLKILPAIIKDKQFNSWPEKAYYIRDNVNQEIIKSSYLILIDAMEEIYSSNNKENDQLINLYLNAIDVFWCALTDENAAKIQVIVEN